jgi:uncharacterized membrane protein
VRAERAKSLRDWTGGVRPDGSVDQHGLAVRRFAVAAAVGIATLAALLAAGVGSAPVAIETGWCAGAIVFIGWIWLAIGHKDADDTARMAAAEDVSRPLADALMIGAAVVSLVAVAFVLHQASQRSGTSKGLLVALALASVALAWISLHTLYTLRYGDLYYQGTVGGIDFHNDERPDYLDLAYVAFTIGMTFQVSDTDLVAREIRRAALRQALLSFVFAAVIVAMAINIVAGLLGH